MRVLSRGRLLVPLLCVLASLLAPIPAAAADDGVHLLAAAGDSNIPQALTPLGQSASGIVYRNEFTSTTWIQPQDAGQPAQEETRLADPTLVGEVLSTWDADASTLHWRTVADATLTQTVVPPGLTYRGRTAVGYAATRGSGPSELVAVDLADDEQTVIGSVATAGDVLAGPLGVAVADPGTPGRWRYFPYDASSPAGQVLDAPSAAGTCALSGLHLLCWSSTQLVRLPLAGGPSTTVATSPRELVASTVGVVYTVPDARYPNAGWHEFWSWRADQPSPVRLVSGESMYGNVLAPVSGGPGVALTSRSSNLQSSGIIRFSGSTSFGTSRVVVAPPQPRMASAVALGAGKAVWAENATSATRPGTVGILGRGLSLDAEGSLTLGGLEGQTQTGTNGAALSVSGDRVSYARTSAPPGLQLTGTRDPQIDAADVATSTLSGQRVLWASRPASGTATWRLTDLSAKTTAALPDAISYDLWGERLVRMDTDGSVWLLDLRTGAAPVEIAPAPASGVESGVVQVAGDRVAWSTTPPGGGQASGTQVRDVASMSPATQLDSLTELEDLSTGYAVGCGGDDGCHPRAVSLLDGTVTAVETGHRLAVDGNLLGFVTTDLLPAVRELPTYDDAPRLLASSGIPATIDITRNGIVARVVASQPLTACALEIRDEQDALVRSFPCTSPRGTSTTTWLGDDAGGHYYVPDGHYRWRIVAENAHGSLVDYDGSAAGTEGTVFINGIPEVEEMWPNSGEVGMSRTEPVKVWFDEPVTGPDELPSGLRSATGKSVPVTVTYDAATRTATLAPTSPLEPLTRYTVQLSGLTDLQGTPVEPRSPLVFSTGPVSNVPHCSLVVPTKVAIGARTTRTDLRIASNCGTHQADMASWNLVHATQGNGWYLRFESADLRYSRWYLDWPDSAPTGRWALRPAGAEQADGNPLPQNSAVVQAKYASRIDADITRTSTSLTWKVTAKQWSGRSHAWISRQKVGVGLFHLAPGSSTWRYVKSATTTTSGRATITLGALKTGSYRLAVAETDSVWASYSRTVRGR